MRRFIVVLLVSASVVGFPLAGSSSAVTSTTRDTTRGEPASVPGELLVGYVDGATATQRSRARGRSSAALQDRVVEAGADRTEVELVTLPQGANRDDAIRRIESDPAVRYAEPNWIVTHQAESNDPYYTNDSLWGMYGDATTPANQNGSQAGEAWAAGNTGSSSVYIGVIDEGIDVAHPDLDTNIWTNTADPVDGDDNDGNGYVDDVHGWDFVNGDNTVYDGGNGDKHGTHVAGTIGAEGNNGAGVAGVAWDVTLISGKFLGPRGGSTANAVKAVDYFTDLKARHNLNVVATNNSWGGGGYSQTLYDAIVRGAKRDILFVAAAGNDSADNDATARYPSAYDTTAAAGYDAVISVASITSTGALSSFSNYGATSVDLGAPGTGVYSTLPKNTYGSYSGTSMATPHVTGGIALYASANPGASASSIRAAVLSTSITTGSLSGKAVTGGRLNVSSFSTIIEGTAPSEPTALVAVGGEGQATLSWAPPTDPGSPIATEYRIYRGTVRVATVPTTETSYTDTGLAGGTYTYQVTAANAVGEGAASDPATATVTSPPAAARTVTVTAGAKKRNLTTVNVVWTGFSGANVDVTRSGSTITWANDGTQDENWRGSGTVTYTICETGTTHCATGSTTI